MKKMQDIVLTKSLLYTDDKFSNFLYVIIFEYFILLYLYLKTIFCLMLFTSFEF